jgi:hypothetical protein
VIALQTLILINTACFLVGHDFLVSNGGNEKMPADAMMVSVAVVAVFVVFMAALFWADKQTSSSGGKSDVSGQKRRSF